LAAFNIKKKFNSDSLHAFNEVHLREEWSMVKHVLRTKEIHRCFIFLNPVKNPMFTRAIFIWPDELIRESVCACAKLFVDEESTNRIVEEQTHWRILYENDTKKRIQQDLCKN
jgi:hypothetical protein